MIIKKFALKSFISLIVFGFLSCFNCFAKEEQNTPKGPTVDEKIEYSKVLYNTNNKKEALELLLSLPVEAQNEEVDLLISNIYSENGDYKNAVLYLKNAVVKNKEYFRAYYNLGVIYQKQKENYLAIENYKIAISKNREFPYSYYNLGCLYLTLKDYKKAKSNFVKAVAYKNDDKDFYYNLAFTYKQLGDEKNAKKILAAYDKLKN